MGCWAKGCIVLIVLGAIISSIVGVGVYTIYKKALKFTSLSPISILTQEVTSQQYEEICNRVRAFRKALLEEDRQSTLELSENEINAYIAMDPKWKNVRGTFYIRLENDRVVSEVSIPLSKILGFKDRYLNATAHLNPTVENGRLKLFLTNFEVSGKQAPQNILEKNQEKIQQSIWQEIAKIDPDLAFLIARIKRLEIQGDKIVVEGGSKPPLLPLPTPEKAPATSAIPPFSSTLTTPSTSPPQPPATLEKTVDELQTTHPTTSESVTPKSTLPEELSPVEKSEGKYLGITLADVKKQLGEPIMTTEEGNTTILHFRTVELYSTNGVTVTSEKPISP